MKRNAIYHFLPSLLFMFTMPFNTAIAQKKLVPVKQSELTGIALPSGSKKDSRLLSEIAGKALLNDEAKKANTILKTVEILYLPAINGNGFDSDTIVNQLTSLGWSITLAGPDEKYVWLQKDNRYILGYFSIDKDATNFYLGEAGDAPTFATNVNNNDTNKTNPVQQTQKTVIQPPVSQDKNVTHQPSGNYNGFAYTTTNFDDGWTSVIKDKWVEVTKGSIKVYISYPQQYNAGDFSGTGKQARHFYWDNYAAKYFTTGEMRYNPGGALSDYSDDYIEGWATDKQTNEKKYIAMTLIYSTNIVNVIIASAPGDQQLRQQFSKADSKFENDLKPMYSYNKFTVGKNDLTGTWVSGGNGAMLTWYSTTTGNNVGSTAVATSDVFSFTTSNTYSSTHNGATGWVGSMNTYQQKYNGTYNVTGWSVTATNRWDGKTEKFDAWFEIIEGGRILHLDSPSIKYSLFKE